MHHINIMEPHNKYPEQDAKERPLFPLSPAAIRALRTGASFAPSDANKADEVRHQ